MTKPQHIPVMVTEGLNIFKAQSGDSLLDATIGLGGHAAAYLEATAPTGRVIGLEADAAAALVATERLASYGQRVTVLRGNFAHLKDSLIGGGIVQNSEAPPLFTHILFDLGVGSHQLSDPQRGFSFQSNGPLTMRYGSETILPPSALPALNHLEHRLGRLPDVADLVRFLSADELSAIIRTYGEERYARPIAQAITAEARPTTTAALSQRIRSAVPASYERGRIHPATRTFQALRMAVNRELEALTAALPQAWEVLKPQGILTVISFHSLEDRLVKHFMRDAARGCICPPEFPQCVCGRTPQATIITKHPLRATANEQARNPRARSAKLRAIRKK